MRIDVKTLPVNDIIRDISSCFGAPVENASGELKIEIPEHIGEGYIRGSSFNSGIGIITYNCKFLEDIDIHFTLNSIHPLKFIFCSQGSVEHCFENSDESVTIDSFQNIIVSSSGYRGHVLSFKKDVAAHVSSLEIIRSVFSNRDNYQFQGIEPELKEIFKDQVSEKEFFYQGNYSLKSADLMDQMATKDFSGFLRSIFIEGKAFEMLVVQIDQYQDDETEDKLPQILRKSDIEKVNYVARRIEGDLAINLTVEALAKEAGTNVNKLQEGFKYVYDLTVNKYIQHRKLEAAKEMLMTSERNISEIVVSIGLNNRSYFSKIFKEKYGVSPKYFRKSSLRQDQD
ncbi:helix-turn-helix domain-containing protein [Zunongwangia endophytica]|uniref:Helix-turn-helix domain-containing protein n=1 Tax=Zunongwangia endophytica TaxID=1808945 RepID=A0ABV8H4S8_9FLAO|nr:AraC family transcriptional regulator [Zunongwangia endophytica]MDN3595438.1 AraC family transcriptional regulator [Zunongwangia endophytica]